MFHVQSSAANPRLARAKIGFLFISEQSLSRRSASGRRKGVFKLSIYLNVVTRHMSAVPKLYPLLNARKQRQFPTVLTLKTESCRTPPQLQENMESTQQSAQSRSSWLIIQISYSRRLPTVKKALHTTCFTEYI